MPFQDTETKDVSIAPMSHICTSALQLLVVYEIKKILHWSQEFCSRGSSTNSVEDRGQREWGSGDASPLVRGSTQFAKE
jgi:hypothetical protein